MLINQQALFQQLKQKLTAVYVLIGQDYYLLNEAAIAITQAWRQLTDQNYEDIIFYLNNPTDWDRLADEANSYSLFAHYRLIDVRYEKKTLEAAGKVFLTSYLQNSNQRCLLLLRAPLLAQKQLQWLINHPEAAIVQVSSLTDAAMHQWISKQLTAKHLQFEPQIPMLIQQFTQGNMLACAQTLEKIALTYEANTLLTPPLVFEQLTDQCDFALFELSNACLANQPDKAIQLLRHAAHNKTEPTLVLWLLAQDIRLLIQLNELTKLQKISFSNACKQLKIWPAKERLYRNALQNSKSEHLIHLLRFCKMVDEQIKSNQNNHVWRFCEQIALSLCFNKQVGHFA